MKVRVDIALVFIVLTSCQLNSKYLYTHPEKDMSGCVNPVANVNVQTEKGQFQNTSFLGLNHFENQSSINISNKLFVQLNGYLSQPIKQGEIGLGFYKVFAKERLMTSSAIGYGYGQTNYLGLIQWSKERGPLNWGGRETMYYTRLIKTSSIANKVFLQSSLTAFSKNKKFSFSLGAKLNYLYYLNYKYRVQNYGTTHFGQIADPPLVNNPYYGFMGLTTEDINMKYKQSFVLNPYVACTVKFKNISLFFQALLNTPLNKEDKQNRDHLINGPKVPLLSTGIMFTLGNKKE